MTERKPDNQAETTPSAAAVTNSDKTEFLSVSMICRSIYQEMSWHDRRMTLVALLCASLYSAGTAALPLLIKLPTQDFHKLGPFTIGHFTLIVALTILFLLRPIFLRGHVRIISKTLKKQIDVPRPFNIAMSHQTLLSLTRDVPLLVLLTGSLAINLGAWAIAASAIIFGGIYLAVWNVKRHRKKRQSKPNLDGNRDFLFSRNARADTEVISDLPQSIMVAGAILWFGFTEQSLSGGVIASLVVNLMLASPPIRKLTRLYVKVSLKTRRKDDDDDDY